jgi:hypothetical protein
MGLPEVLNQWPGNDPGHRAAGMMDVLMGQQPRAA